VISLMGEAKRRAAKDPSFGKPKRGLIVSCPMAIDGARLTIKSSSLDPQELRSSLLYFDKLAWPTNKAIHVGGSGPDVDFLSAAKVLELPHVTLIGSFGVEAVVFAQAQALRDLDEKNPGTWAIAQGENSLLVKNGTLTDKGGLALELYRAVPVPDKDVPLNEILEFRLKRYDELQALRNEIDRLVSEINASEDPKATIEDVLYRIDRECSAAIRVCSEWQFPVRLSSLKTSFDLKPFAMVRDGLGAYVGATALGTTAVLTAALVGAAAAAATVSLKITPDFGWRGLKDRSSPYRYVSRFHKELF
jgi:hypothetical protein